MRQLKFIGKGCFTRNFWLKQRWQILKGIMKPYEHWSNTLAKSGLKEKCFFHIMTTAGYLAVTGLKFGCSILSLPLRVSSVQLLVVLKIQRDIERTTFFFGWRSWSCCVRMDPKPTRNFRRAWNERMDSMFGKPCSNKLGLCWKISPQCLRKINFLHCDITFIILYYWELILYSIIYNHQSTLAF